VIPRVAPTISSTAATPIATAIGESFTPFEECAEVVCARENCLPRGEASHLSNAA
jgi:hypothetical protein